MGRLRRRALPVSDAEPREGAAGPGRSTAPNVILSIFASRARSREAMTQVELARLQYLLPRLTGAQSGLAQQRGGGAFRAGGGEKKLELDKRKIRRRIATLKEDLEKIERSRTCGAAHLRNVATVCLVGYTNAGKTTLFNRLTSSKEFAEDRLFATLDARHARLLGVGGRADRRLRHGRLPPQAPARPRRLVPLDAEGGRGGGPPRPRRRRVLLRRRRASAAWPRRSSPSWASRSERVLLAYNKIRPPRGGASRPPGEIAISAVTASRP